MSDFRELASGVSVAGALTLQDIDEVAQKGFRTLINFRVDGESVQQLESSAARQAAERLGLTYIHIPASKHELFTDAVVDAASEAFTANQGPILAHCAGGQRAAIVWAAAAARKQPVSQVLEQLKLAGFDLAFLKDDLDAQADRARWQTTVDTSTPPQSETSLCSREAA